MSHVTIFLLTYVNFNLPVPLTQLLLLLRSYSLVPEKNNTPLRN